MPVSELILSLQPQLSSNTKILTDPNDKEFKERLERWSDINIQVPAAIICPGIQLDVGTIVKFAREHSIPFVPASGGHSSWSTIDSSGFILDLKLLNSVVISQEKSTVVVSGAVLVKELAAALSQAGRCTTLGNGNTVGVIPYCLGGGTSILTAVAGYACDQITEAKVVTANGSIIQTQDEPELLWAIKGAGCFLGVVLELTLKTFPLSILGSNDGSHWIGKYIYSLDRAEEVCKVLEPIIVDNSYDTAGAVMVIAPPPAFQPVLLVEVHFLGDSKKAPAVYQSLVDLGPMMMAASTPLFHEYRDSKDRGCVKGDFKRFSLVGVTEFKAENFLKVVDIFKELLSSCPDASASGYVFEWHTASSKPQTTDSAFSYPDVTLWMNTFSWYRQAKNGDTVLDFENRALAAMRTGQTNFIDYPSCNRSSPVEQRYKGADRLARLRELKLHWDPEGVFTREFL